MRSASTGNGTSACPIASIVPTKGVSIVADQFLEQALLVAEVEIDSAFGDARAARHVLEAGGLEAAAGKFVERGGQNGFAAFTAARLTSGAGRHRRSTRRLGGTLASAGAACCRLSKPGYATHRYTFVYD